MLIVEKRNSEKYKVKEENKNQVHAYFGIVLFRLFQRVHKYVPGMAVVGVLVTKSCPTLLSPHGL